MMPLRSMSVILTSVLICVSVACADNPLEWRFIWNEANSRMAAARTEDDFHLAGEAYRKLLHAGVRNGPLFYNLGTALLKAERYDEAIAALLRAERYMGTTPDIRRNMLIALARRNKDETVALPWYRFPLFWHYGLAVSTRVNITVLAFAALWVSFVLRVLGFRRVFRRMMNLSLVAVIVFGSSAATSLHQEVESEISMFTETAQKALELNE